MNVRYLILMLVASLAMHTGEAFSQEPVEQKPREPLYFIGLYGAYNRTIHTADFRELPGFPSCCPRYTSTAGSGVSFGGLLEFEITPFIKLQTRIGFATLGADFSVAESIGNTPITQNGRDTTTPITVQHFLGSTINTLGFEPTVALKFLGGFYSRVGMNASYMLAGNFTQRETIQTPENVVFQNSGKSIRNEGSGEIPDKNLLQFSAVIGISYELPIGGGSFIEPDIRYALPITNISGVSWKVGSLQVGASLKFPIYPTPNITVFKDTVYKRDTSVTATLGITKTRITKQKTEIDVRTVREGTVDHQTTTITENFLKEVPLNSKFDMSIAAFGVEKNGVRQPNPTIRIEEIETEEGFPLLPHVFFIEGSTMLSQTDVHQLTPEKAAQFNEEQLPRNTLEIYKDMLNIIGSRMQRYPSAAITITGTNNTINTDKTTPNLSRDRAETVRTYLQNAWSIAPERINIAAQNLPSNAANNTADDGQVENRRAEISSNEPELLKPVILREIARSATPPYIELQPRVISDSGIKSWTMRVTQNGEELRSYQGSGLPATQRWDILEKPQPMVETPVSVTLEAIDALGIKKSVDTSITVRQLTIRKKREELHDDKKIERFSLIVFDYNSATLSKLNKQILEDVKRRIQPNSTVTIAGYADRTGEQGYNLDLASRRCVEVQKFLNVPAGNVTLMPKGSSELIYDNTTPQGRSYSRTVQVVIETPVK